MTEGADQTENTVKTVEILGEKHGVEILALDGGANLKLGVPIEIIESFIASLDAFEGYVAGGRLKDNAIKLRMLASDLKQIREHYYFVVANEGYDPNIDYEMNQQIQEVMKTMQIITKQLQSIRDDE